MHQCNSKSERSRRVVMMQGQIRVTENDMAALEALIIHGRAALRRDMYHLDDLGQELERAEVVADGEVPPDVMTMNSTARVRDLSTGATAVYTVVFPADADVASNRISVLAPVGTALIGYRRGDEVEWRTPGGARRLLIEEVLFQPEATEARMRDSHREGRLQVGRRPGREPRDGRPRADDGLRGQALDLSASNESTVEGGASSLRHDGDDGTTIPCRASTADGGWR
jgi:regulator of nucleoside diphosphate kinase